MEHQAEVWGLPELGPGGAGEKEQSEEKEEVGSAEKVRLRRNFFANIQGNPTISCGNLWVKTVVRSLFVPGTMFQGLFQQSQVS
jgi:hypothetical protein